MIDKIVFLIHIIIPPLFLSLCIRSLNNSSIYLKDLNDGKDVSDGNIKYKEFTEKYENHVEKEIFGTKILIAYIIGIMFLLIIITWGNLLFLTNFTQKLALFFTKIFTFQFIDLNSDTLIELYSLRAFSFNFLQFYLVISLLNAPILMFIIIYLIFFLNQKSIMESIIPSLSYEISFNVFMLYFITSIVLAILFSFLGVFIFTIYSKKPCDALNENCLKLAEEHFDPIIITEGEYLNFANGIYFNKNFLMIVGDLNLLTEEEIFACILHEIGHGGIKILLAYFLFNYLVSFLMILLTYFFVSSYVNILFGPNYGAIKTTLMIVNLPLISLISKFIKNFINFKNEYVADLYVKDSGYTGNLINALLKLHYASFMPNKMDYFINLVISSHSSNFYRIKNLYSDQTENNK